MIERFKKQIKYYSSGRPEFVSIFPPEVERVLDVGCGAGNLGKQLKEHGVKEVVGIEMNEEAAAIAASSLDEVIRADIEDTALVVDVGAGFDVIIFADVLEHLVDPWEAMERFSRYLKKGGYFLVSIPNIRYWQVIAGLVFRGEFRYEEHGIMDIGHLRFFTLKMIEEYLRIAGFVVVKKKRNFSGYISRILNIITFNIFADFATRQYIILAKHDADSMMPGIGKDSSKTPQKG